MTDTTDRKVAETFDAYVEQHRASGLVDLKDMLVSIRADVAEGLALTCRLLDDRIDGADLDALKCLGNAVDALKNLLVQADNGEFTVQTMPEDQLRQLHAWRLEGERQDGWLQERKSAEMQPPSSRQHFEGSSDA